MNLALSAIAALTHGVLHGADLIVRNVATDTRRKMPGALFVALKGDSFDGHDFLAQAKEAGAVAALVSRFVTQADLPQVVVADTQLALGDLARGVRAQRRARVVGITGSNGKTTVKTLVASILALHGKTHVNPGNFNNEIGLPLALLALPEDADYAVFEMGAGKPADIAYLAAIAQPQIGLVNNVAPAHLERIGTLEDVAKTKGALYAALPENGVAVINADDAFAPFFAGIRHAGRTIRFGLEQPAEVCAEIRALGAGSRFVLHSPAGNCEIDLPLAGRHNVSNALAAAAIALALEVPLDRIRQGLESAPAVHGRLTRHAMRGGWTLIDDSYNANPGSTAAAIATLAAQTQQGWLVLGDMRELGKDANALHEQIGRLAKASGIARLYAVGEHAQWAARAFGAGAAHFADRGALVRALAGEVRAGATVLVKGSRGSAMERIVEALLEQFGDGGARDAA